MSRNPYANAKSYTRWSIRRLSVGVASVVVASGFFIITSNPAVHADQLSEPTSAVTASPVDKPVETAPAVVENTNTETTSATETTNKGDQVAPTTSEVAVKEDGLNTADQAPAPSAEIANKEEKPAETLLQAETVSAPVGEDRAAQPAPEKMEDVQTSPAEVKTAVAENVKESTDVPASYLEKANVPGPFLAGVNQVIPYEAFGGDGMLTRLLLKSSDKAPWSDNGTAKNPALLPLDKLGHGQYFYEVDLNGNTAGKDGQALLDQLRANGTQAYTATVKVYAAKDGKADLTNIVASRDVNVQLNGITTAAQVKQAVAENVKASIDVPASYLEKANVPGPFLAGVNQVIPYEAFGGDGMLTRLLLKSSDKAPWSDNGTAKNPALLPLEKLGHGQYFYEVDLNGNTVGKDGQVLLDQLRANGTQAYTATVKVYAAKDGKADLTNLVVSRDVNVQLNGITSPDQVKQAVAENVKESIDVPASYLEKANVPGPFLAGVNQVIPYEAFGGDGMLTRLLLKSSDQAPWSDNGTAKNPALLPLDKLGHGQYFYEVDLNGNTVGKDGQVLLDQLRANGTQAYTATVKVYAAKDGKADLTNLVASRDVNVQLNGITTADQVKQAVAENVKASIDVPASYLDKANVPGPFLAGVNQVIPYEAFGGDGMLTRLLLKSSDKAPWSDNGTAKNPALLPLEKLGHGQYFYEVDLNGNTTGKDGQALLDQLRANGTQAYTATVKVYAAKDGKADLTNLVASRDVNVQLNGITTASQVKQAVADNVKDSIDVPASYLEKANVPGPFLAGVNQVIPYEFFGGDGMLTRLLLKSSDGTPWSDNGTAKNPALLPLEKLGHGQYFYEVDLNGNTVGKDGQALLDQLRANGTQAYTVTVKVYAAKDGKADLNNLVASRDVNVQLNGVTTPKQVKQAVADNVKDSIDVPASYLDKANVPGPFLAGVNQVIPYEAFGGDGMLTRLLLKSSDQAPWSDNGTAKNPALLPLEKLGHGQYFYEVDLNGNTTGKDGQALLDQLRANGTQAYTATVKVYAVKDGKADLTNLVATRQVVIQLHGRMMANSSSSQGMSGSQSGMSSTPMNGKMMSGQDSKMMKMDGSQASQGMSGSQSAMSSTPMNDKMMSNQGSKMDMMSTSSANMMASGNSDKMLPNTGETRSSLASMGVLGMVLTGILAGLGLAKKDSEK